MAMIKSKKKITNTGSGYAMNKKATPIANSGSGTIMKKKVAKPIAKAPKPVASTTGMRSRKNERY